MVFRKGTSQENLVTHENSDSYIYIYRDSLIQMICKYKRHDYVEYYLVIYLITKYYNKGYIAKEDKFKWRNFSKTNHILASTVSAFETTSKEIIP